MNAMNYALPELEHDSYANGEVQGQRPLTDLDIARLQRDHACDELTRVKEDLHKAKVDLDRLRSKLLNALNKGLVIDDMGEIVNRLDRLWDSIPDETTDLNRDPGWSPPSTA
jgi:hypothetical protein